MAKKGKKHREPRYGFATQRLAKPSSEVWADVSWPLLACYGPRPEVWQVSGFGTIFVARRKPNNEEVWALAVISLSDGGITTAGGKRAALPGEHKQRCSDLRNLDRFPASIELPEAVVGDYFYGACALRFGTLPEAQWPREVREVSSLLRPPPGGPAAWREHLVGPNGMTPEGLMNVVRGHGHAADIPAGKDPLVRITACVSLRPGTAQVVARRLLGRRRPPLFVDMGKRGTASVLEWVKPYTSGIHVPTGQKVSALYGDEGTPHSVTFRILTDKGHQGMGQIAVSDDSVEVEALTLSRASMLMGVLLEAAGAPVTIDSTEWSPLVSPADALGW